MQWTALGINYGMVADNLPPPTEVVKILQSMSVTQTRIYNADPKVLRAFASTGISVMVSIGNEDVSRMTDTTYAAQWVESNIAAFYPSTIISGILVGNEVFTGEDAGLIADLLPAIHNIYGGLKAQGLHRDILVSTAHSLAVLDTSYPPSAGQFAAGAAKPMVSLLSFLSETQAPFMINAYPYFAYKADPGGVSLQYVLSSQSSSSSTPAGTSTAEVLTSSSSEAAQAASTVTDPSTGLLYTGMLDAQVDAVYAAIAAAGFGSGVSVIVSETGWPSSGDPDEAGASVGNAQEYNANLVARLASGRGTPAHPAAPLTAFIFALFNENQKPGPSSERHYGLLYPNGSRVYDVGPTSSFSSSYSYSSLYAYATMSSSSSSSSPSPLPADLCRIALPFLFLFFFFLRMAAS